jgi:MoxR-like ATPase
MQERQVTIGDQTYRLDQPFFVMATQNPIDQEGTYPLPEAQVDRFMMLVKVDYPTFEEERLVMDRQLSRDPESVNPIITTEAISNAQKVIHQIYLDEKVKEYILKIIFATRNPAEVSGLADYKSYIQYGASPRASIWMAKAARAHAFMKRRGYVIPEDIKALAPDILRHRVTPTYEAEARDITSDDLVQRILEAVEVP